MSSWQFIYNSFTLMHILHLSVNSHVTVIEQKLPTNIVTNLDRIPIAAVLTGNTFSSKHQQNPQTLQNSQTPNQTLHNYKFPNDQFQSKHQKLQQEQEKQLKTTSRELVSEVHKQTAEAERYFRPKYRWLSRHQAFGQSQHHLFKQWSRWSKCSHECRQSRQRVCKLRRKCGHTKHVEERRCRRCFTNESRLGSTNNNTHREDSIAINRTVENLPAVIKNTTEGHPNAVRNLPITALNESKQLNLDKDRETQFIIISNGADSEETEFYIIKDRSRHNHRHKHHGKEATREQKRRQTNIRLTNTQTEGLISANKRNRTNKPTTSTSTFQQSSDEHLLIPDKRLQRNNSHTPWLPYKRKKHRNRKPKHDHKGIFPKHNLPSMESDFDGDIFQYDDFDIDYSSNRSLNPFSDEISSSASASASASLPLSSYEEDSMADTDQDVRNTTYLMQQMERATPNYLIPRHRRIYSKWSRWTKCSPKCTTRRYKKCRIRELCGREVLREIAYCYTEGSFCQQWLQAQVQKSPPYELKPMAARRRDNSGEGMLSNSIDGDFILNSKGYRGSEYSPMKLKCGIAAIRSNRRNVYNMLKIIGGKASRKGEWPWQVAIFNRNKEAFCGGTLIAPQWVLTAAHCVRKVLYVRMGEHNLDYEDGSELQLRIIKSYKHPNFDKKTVDSDVALLKLPKSINTTSWIGFSCLPRPYQPLPKNMDCTVIGWGKRRNRDVAGTSVLHQAEVPIIPMENCRSVYQDYTITKNMFCAGHKRGRIDTCAGDSGGPLLCRDTTKPNHPWTIFGITSFGDGCAKRNKFGIYAKVPNYVDWVWSVVNCNGNCKMSQANTYTI